MSNELFQHPTRLEEFCSFIVTNLNNNNNNNNNDNNDSSSISLRKTLELLESHCRNVWSEFTTLTQGEANSSSLVMKCYSQVLQEGIIEFVMNNKIIKNRPSTHEGDDNLFIATTTTSTPFSVTDEDVKFIIKIKRSLAGLLSLTENYSAVEQNNDDANHSPSPTKNPTPNWRQIRHILLKTARETEANLNSFSANNICFSATHTLQKQVSMSSSAAIAENFRLLGNVFDQRRSITEVSEILQRTNTNQTRTTNSYDYHIKTILPVVGASSLRQQINMLVEKYLVLNKKGETGENEETSSCKLGHVIPDLAFALQHLLGDVTNLLFRVSSQTPKNSPNCGYLAFLICDVSFYLAPYVISTFHQQRNDDDDDELSTSSSSINILFSSKFFHPYLYFRNESNDDEQDRHVFKDQSHRWLRGGNGDLSVSACTKLEVALGCAIDCLNADLEVAVSECCHKFETAAAPTATINNNNNNNKSSSNQPLPSSPEKQTRNSNNDDNSSTPTPKPFDLYSVCSEGMVQLLANVMNPLMSVFRFFSSSSSSSSDVRCRILSTALRLACSYWLRQDLKSAKQDLKILFQFSKNSLGSGENGDERLVKIVEKFERRL